MGATGNVGSSVVEALKNSGETVIAVAHSEEKAKALASANVEPVVVDVLDTAGLRAVFQRGRRAFC
ncbi:NAD(P)H-binding protein [Devosia lacusdianchii]|uniref:NAD(P)H-binding protein n=1 Tax=Devosia lacusdianchii TaxID=2917991 RepID=UPI0023D9EBEE|nr:NAD(P)H-binding protein [Devosia sp. JXJ CY 41]